eukprot:TRINITY_DN17663_c0_g1_i1.p1 TRINITY_DN17663_c0_g1~~TRINITY_DN17663_c0_g1_i1.p1  ORF type:complete len:339 (+),score=38.17 TRINITY_DN17663_c0_g1_i1:87-1103(+)
MLFLLFCFLAYVCDGIGLPIGDCDPVCGECIEIGQCPGNTTVNQRNIVSNGIRVQCFKINCDQRPDLQWGTPFMTGCSSSVESCDTCNGIYIKSSTTSSQNVTTEIGAPVCGSSQTPRFSGESVVIIYNVTQTTSASITLTWSCTGCPDPPVDPPEDEDDSNISFLIAVILVILALILTAYCLYHHHCQKDRGKHHGDAKKDLGGSLLEDEHRQREAKKRAEEQLRRNQFMQQEQQQRMPRNFEDRFDHKGGNCSVEFRNGDEWRRGEIISSLPGGMCIVSGTGGLEVVISKADVREIVNPLLCEESEGFQTMKRRHPNACKIASASEPSCSPKDVIQ